MLNDLLKYLTNLESQSIQEGSGQQSFSKVLNFMDLLLKRRFLKLDQENQLIDRPFSVVSGLLTETTLRDALFKIESLIDRSSITNHLLDQQDFQKVLIDYTSKVADRIDECFVIKPSSQATFYVKWPKDLTQFIKMIKHACILKSELQKLLDQH